MNHVYRLVFNRALGVIQVVSELATSTPGGRSGPRRSLRPHRLAQACALLLATGLAGMAPSAMAATATGTAGGNGGAGTSASAGAGGSGASTGGSGGSSSGGAGASGGGSGGSGGAYYNWLNTRGGGGGGGGGVGGTGQTAGYGYGQGASGGAIDFSGVGGGGGGGSGSAGRTYTFYGNVYTYSNGGGGGGGGGGGIGVSYSAGGSNANAGVITGGAGGAGGAAGGAYASGAGGGGGGGAGVVLDTVAGGTLANTGSIIGGAGGAGGDGNGNYRSRAGGGGAGGFGVVMNTAGTLSNTGTISGGAGGAAGYGYSGRRGTAGEGGIGIAVTGGATIVNGGTISGGLSGDGATRADAILFTGTGNTLNLQTGSNIDGTIALGISRPSPTPSTDGSATIAAIDPGLTLDNTIQLDTAGSALTFDTSSAAFTASGTIQGVGSVTKAGAGTLTLTGSNTFSGGTTIEAGTLSVSSNANLGATAGGVLLDGGTLQNTAAFTLDHALSLGASGGMLQVDADLTVAQAITGAGSLTEIGAGTLILGGNVTTAGSQTLNGALALGANIAMTSTGGGNIAFNAVLDGAHALTVNTTGSTAFNTVGGSTALTSLTTDAGGSTTLDGNVTTTGAQTYNDAVTLGADDSLTSTGGGAITFNSTVDGAHQLDVTTGGAVAFNGTVGGLTALTGLTVTGGSFTAAAMDTSNLSLTTTAGGISQTGAFNVGGFSTFDATGAITLTNAGNDFGTIDATGNGIAISDADDLNIITLTSTGSGDIVIDAGGALSAGTILGNGGDVSLTAAGDVSTNVIDAGVGNITVRSNGGTLSILDNLSGQDIALAGAGGVGIAANIDAAGSLALGSVGGNIVQTGGVVTVTQSATVTAAGTISLAGAGNDFRDLLNLSSGGSATITDLNALLLGTVDTGDLTVQSTGRLGLGGGSVNGNLVANSTGGDIVQLSGLTVSGTSSLDSGSGSITLTNANNDFVGPMSITAGAVSIVDRNDLTVSALTSGTNADVSLIAGGVLSLPVGAIDTGTGDLTLASNGGTLATTGALSGANVSLTGRDGIALGANVTGTTVDLETTNASIDQLGGILTADTLTGSTGTGDVSLTSPANAIGTITDFTAGDFTLVDGTALSITGNLSASGDIVLYDFAGITVTGAVSAGGSTTLVPGTAMTIGSGGTVGSLAGDVVIGGGSSLGFDRSDDVTFAGAISGSGTLGQIGTGTLALDGASGSFTGTTQVASGTLLVGSIAGNGATLGGDVNVAGGASLGGHGSIGGNVDLANGAHLTPGNSIGTLTIGGDATFAQGSVLDYEFGAPGADFTNPGNGDSVAVGGNLSLAGAVLNVSDAGGMGPGIYNLFSYGGTLSYTNGGIVFGVTPGGEALQIQNLTGDKQINLVDTTGMTLDFWNGNGLATPTSLGGGDGTWSTTAMNWTDANASVSAAMQPQPGFAIFGGAAGTVTIDGVDGAVTATGLQFASDGYILQGDPLTLIGNGVDAPIIRVGNGSATGAGYTATIDSVIDGTDGLAKTDAGTLVLTADNLFSGGVSIEGGELSVASDGNLGDAGNALSLDGGLLQVTGTAFNGTARAITLGGNGGGFDIADAANVFTLTQALSGTGDFIKSGDGTLVLTGANSFTGGTTIDAGVLQVGAGGTSGSLAGDVVDNATLVFDRSGTLGVSGAISGSGALVQQGDGTTILTADNSFTGGTAVTAGTLQIGAGGTTGSLVGDVLDNAELVFDRSDAIAFGGVLSGNGSLVQQGAGTLTLDGDSSGFTGSTDVADGVLVIGSAAGNGAALGGDVSVDSGATLAGNGSIGGDVDVASGAHLAPGNGIGTLTIDGDATFAQGSVLDFDFGTTSGNFLSSGAGDSVAVGGDLTLDGATLNVTDAGGMGPGLYTLFTWTGTLSESNGGIALGSTAGQTLYVQTLTGDQQINLIDTTGMILNFWNGNGLASATQLGGGDGTWSATAMNWTDAAGTVTASMQPQPGFAIFGGAAGNVTIDNGSGAVAATGMQFASDGYTLDGDMLTLVADGGAAPVIRVGNGSSADAGMTATIGNVLAGSDGLVKADYGTLVLGGDNTFSGGVTVAGGTLSVGSDANLGDAGNALALDGGVLQVTGTAFTGTARDVTLGSHGGGFDIADAGNVFTLDQAFSGSGAFAKSGDGTLVLTADNTFSGGTTIAGGTLQLGDGGSTGMITGDVIDNGTLAFDRSDDVRFLGTLGGSGALVQQGAGTLVLDADSSAFAGTTEVKDGRLVVGSVAGGGAALGGDVDVDGGATLAGLGAIGGDVVNAGALSPGMGVGTLTIHGDYTQTADGSLVIDALADGQADRLVVDGDASLDGSTLVLAAGVQWQPLTQYTILTAGGAVDGSFASATSSLLFLDPVLDYGAHAVHLTLQRNDIEFASAGLTRNQRAAAAAADTLGFGNAAYDALTTLDAGSAPAAFDALSGELHASVQTSLMEDSSYLRSAMQGRLDAARTDGHGVWATGWGHWARDDSDGNAAELRSDGHGLAAGADAAVGDDARIGVVVGASRASARVDDRDSHADIDSRHLGMYGRMTLGSLQLQAGAARSWHDVDSHRQVAFAGFGDSLRGKGDASTTQAYLDASHDFTVAGGTLSPYLDMARVQVRAEGFSETGGDAALRVDPAHTSRTFATAGMRGDFAFARAWRLQGSLGWSHAFGGDGSPTVQEAFVAGSDEFVVAGVPIADNAVTVQAGLGYQATQAFRINASYIGRFASDARDQGAGLTLAWSF